MSRIYYRDAYAAIIVFDVMNAESWSRLQYWITEIQTFEPDCKIYICANKIDLLQGQNRNRATDYHDTTDYAEANRVRIFEVSCKTGKNIRKLFNAVLNDFLDDPNIGYSDSERIILEQRRTPLWEEPDLKRKSKCC